jgi:hypothetical protein
VPICSDIVWPYVLQQASALEAELRAAKERVDLAQVRTCMCPLTAGSRQHAQTPIRTCPCVTSDPAAPITASIKAAWAAIDTQRSDCKLCRCYQARKEQLWELAKEEGARGDVKSDTHYVKNVAGQ